MTMLNMGRGSYHAGTCRAAADAAGQQVFEEEPTKNPGRCEGKVGRARGRGHPGQAAQRKVLTMFSYFGVIPDGQQRPVCFFRDLEDAIEWGLSRYGSDRFRICHQKALPSASGEGAPSPAGSS
jgi:hypothetical protein